MGGQQYGDMAVPQINMPYIKKVLAHIEADTRRFEMRSYYGFKPGGDMNKSTDWAECGTKACFGGWGVFLNIPDGSYEAYLAYVGSGIDVRREAAKLFGFTQDEAVYVFEGPASYPLDREQQLSALKDVLNAVFEKRGMPDRV